MTTRTPTRRKTARPKTAPKGAPLPPMLVALAALVQQVDDPDAMRAALRAAHTALREADGDYPDALHTYIDRAARTGWNKDAIEKARLDALDLSGAIHNAFAIPGVLVGLALAYVVMMNDREGR